MPRFWAILGWAMLMGSQIAAGRAAEPTEYVVFFGTYTDTTSQGIYCSYLNPAAGTLSEPALLAEIKNPSFLALHPNARSIYAVSEISDLNGQPTGGVVAFAIDWDNGRWIADRQLRRLNEQPSGGAGPCHLTVDATGRAALVANYGGGSVASLPIDADGLLGPPASVIQHHGASADPGRQEGPHAHSINLDKDDRFAFAADLGLDQVLVYRFSAERAMLQPHDPPYASVAPGAGPRHFAFHPSGKFAYVINELGNTVTAFAYDAGAGRLSEIQTISTLPEGYSEPSYTAEVQVHPSGKFLYGSNRGHDSLAIFSIDQTTGLLTVVGHEPTGGKFPRNFGIDPSGRYVLAANQDSDNVVFFAVNQETGELSRLEQELQIGKPVCVKFLPLYGGAARLHSPAE